jgi:hypothetical protein
VEEEVGRQPLRLLPAVPLRPRRRSPLKRKRKKRSRMRTWVLVSLIKFLAYKERPDQVHRAEGRCPIISDFEHVKNSLWNLEKSPGQRLHFNLF